MALGHAEKIWITAPPKTTKQTRMFMKRTIWKKIHLLKISKNNNKTHQRILIFSIMRNLRFIFLMTQGKKFMLKTLKGYSGKKKERSDGHLVIQQIYNEIRTRRTVSLLQMKPLYFQ